MARIKSETLFELFNNIKKRPGMYLNKKSISNLAALNLGFWIGYSRCCDENKCSIESDDLLWNAFLDRLCEKYEINSPWYNELIEKCGSDENAYDVFMNELEQFIIENDLQRAFVMSSFNL